MTGVLPKPNLSLKGLIDPPGLILKPDSPTAGIPAPAPPPPPPAPVLMPDPEDELAKKRARRKAAASLQSGRASTILSDSAGERLGA